jgi:hypothetical protein
MTGRRGPTPIDGSPRLDLTVRQAEALLRLRDIVLNFPNAVAPTRSIGLNMGTLRALESKGYVGWRRFAANAQGVFVTPAGDTAANHLLAAREAAKNATA